MFDASVRAAIRPQVVGALLSVLALSAPVGLSAQEGEPAPEHVRAPNGEEYALYPALLDEPPDVRSPFLTEDQREILVVELAEGNAALMDVTCVEDTTLKDGRRVIFGPGRQLSVGCEEFPTLARAGLHAAEELERVTAITGRRLADINRDGQPGQISSAGFLARGEDLISVLEADDETVRALGLTHPQLARPLFHLWNLILVEMNHGHSAARSSRIPAIRYLGRTVRLKTGSSRGYQESLFQDEIIGNSQIWLSRDLTAEEEEVLRRAYPDLPAATRDEVVRRLTRIHTGEMVAFYISRYGFYEGHTSYRADPVALAWMFGLRTLEEIEAALPGRLPALLARDWPD